MEEKNFIGFLKIFSQNYFTLLRDDAKEFYLGDKKKLYLDDVENHKEKLNLVNEHFDNSEFTLSFNQIVKDKFLLNDNFIEPMYFTIDELLYKSLGEISSCVNLRGYYFQYDVPNLNEMIKCIGEAEKFCLSHIEKI
jgi:hypothetical protein